MTCIVNFSEIDRVISLETLSITTLLCPWDIEEWITRITKRHIIKNKAYLVPVRDFAMNGDLLSRHVQIAVEGGETLYEFIPSPNFSYIIQYIMDWANGLKERDPRRFKKLQKMTFAQVYATSKLWHRQLAKAAEKLINREIPDDQVNAPTVLDAPSMGEGWHWVWLKTDEARRLEGLSMGHCVGSGGYENQLYGEAIVSLRDPKCVPHVTMQLYRLEQRQTVCKGNSEVSEAYATAVEAAYQILGLRLSLHADPTVAVGDGVHRNGGTYTYHVRNQILHREDGPAFDSDDYKGWYYEGRLHNSNGPAVLTAFIEEWYEDGVLFKKKFGI